MKYGILSGATWGLDTVVLAIAVSFAPFVGASQAPLASALLHDLASAVILLIYMGVRGRLSAVISALRTRAGKIIAAGAVLGGPVGMSGYLIAINNIGPSYTAIISTFYPALGTLLAFVVLRERMRPRQLLALGVALAAIIVIGWAQTTSAIPGSAFVGTIAALLCVVGWGSEAVVLTWGMRDDAVDNEIALQIRQLASALVYLFIVAPVSRSLVFAGTAVLTPAALIIGIAALAGTASYLFYYTALGTIGAARGMALNISYSAWAVVFALVLQSTVPSFLQVACCITILIGTVLTATPEWASLLPQQFTIKR